ncbi:hypothetical protein NUSPORA_01425 [Nucleospora cyclopteri]
MIKSMQNKLNYDLSFMPGTYALKEIPTDIINTTIRIVDLMQMIDERKIESKFFHERIKCTDETAEKFTIINVEANRKHFTVSLSNSIFSTSKSREKIGELFIVSDKTDFMIVLEREIIVSQMEKHEGEELEKIKHAMEEVCRGENRNLIDLFISMKTAIPTFNLKCITIRRVKDNLYYDTIYDGKEINEKYYYKKGWVADIEDMSSFERNFSKLFKQYIMRKNKDIS